MNGEQGTGNGERGTGNRELGMGNEEYCKKMRLHHRKCCIITMHLPRAKHLVASKVMKANALVKGNAGKGNAGRRAQALNKFVKVPRTPSILARKAIFLIPQFDSSTQGCERRKLDSAFMRDVFTASRNCVARVAR